MKWTLESLAEEYKSANTTPENAQYIGIGAGGLKIFFSAVGFTNPAVTADLSMNIVSCYQSHILKNLNEAYAAVTLLDTQRFLSFVFNKGGTRVDYSSVIKVDLQAISKNDFQSYEQHPRWKN